jgi:hypothetical protein
MTSRILPPDPGSSPLLRADSYPHTRKAHRVAWRTLVTFCEAQALQPLPASAATVCAFLAARPRPGGRSRP